MKVLVCYPPFYLRLNKFKKKYIYTKKRLVVGLSVNVCLSVRRSVRDLCEKMVFKTKQKCRACWLRVCYQRGLPRLV